MALPPQLAALKRELTATGYTKRTSKQDALLKELEGLDDVVTKRAVDESIALGSTTMTGSGAGCPCCGR